MTVDVGEKTVESGSQWVSEAEGRWVLFSTVLPSSMAFINQSALNVALPALQSALNASGAELLCNVNSYTLILASLILIGGSLGDKLGRKKIFMIGIALFALSSLACGLSPTILFLITARAAQGIGGALHRENRFCRCRTGNPEPRGARLRFYFRLCFRNRRSTKLRTPDWGSFGLDGFHSCGDTYKTSHDSD